MVSLSTSQVDLTNFRNALKVIRDYHPRCEIGYVDSKSNYPELQVRFDEPHGDDLVQAFKQIGFQDVKDINDEEGIVQKHLEKVLTSDHGSYFTVDTDNGRRTRSTAELFEAIDATEVSLVIDFMQDYERFVRMHPPNDISVEEHLKNTVSAIKQCVEHKLNPLRIRRDGDHQFSYAKTVFVSNAGAIKFLQDKGVEIEGIAAFQDAVDKECETEQAKSRHTKLLPEPFSEYAKRVSEPYMRQWGFR